ncbi:MAG: MEDS domain-containing protein [Prolixibacteraceae bacterium]|nr:MEDS domain-containing protein [Prolixibacteraceae bacterium]
MHIHTSNQQKLKLGIGEYTCNWGVHICGLYESEKERDEIIFGFLKQGCINNDLHFYCFEERTKKNFHNDFVHFCPECQEKIQNEDVFIIKPARDLYYPNGTFDPWHMDDSLNSFYQQSQAKRKVNIRATAEMTWAIKAIPGVEHLMAYEARLNYFIPGKPWISICLYNLNKFSGKFIMKVLQVHPYSINGGIIIQNPYYIHPDKWLAENSPQFLTRKRNNHE